MEWSGDNFVWLVDRTTLGGDEVFYDGRPIVFAAGEVKKYVPRDFVAWLYRTDKKRVWTTDGLFVHRYAVENPPQSLIDHCGPEVGDCSPIEVDKTRLEGWDTSGVEGHAQTLNVNQPASEMRERLGSGGRAITMAR